jgi:localization factor PodJL
MRLAKSGNLQAQHALAIDHAVGRGVRIDLARARYWYALAAGRGESDATFNYAAMLLTGEGGPPSRDDAMRWLRKASREGSTDADILLGDIAMATPGRAAAVKRAARSYALAALRGDVRGLRNLLDLLSASGKIDAVREGIEQAGHAG